MLQHFPLGGIPIQAIYGSSLIARLRWAQLDQHLSPFQVSTAQQLDLPRHSALVARKSGSVGYGTALDPWYIFHFQWGRSSPLISFVAGRV